VKGFALSPHGVGLTLCDCTQLRHNDNFRDLPGLRVIQHLNHAAGLANASPVYARLLAHLLQMLRGSSSKHCHTN
jgi:hypothetical protein